MLCPSGFPLKEGKDNGSGMEELGPGKSPGPVPGPDPRPFIVGRLRRADTFEMLPKRLVLVNWVRGDTREEKGLWACMPELGGWDPPSRFELVRSREGFTEGVPPSWLEGPDGTIIEAKLKLTEDWFFFFLFFVLLEQREATIQPLPSILVERSKVRS